MDASDYALTPILSTRTSNGDLHPITFHSCSFNSTELNYDTHDKELLAIFEGFKHWRQYLEGTGTPINVMTNHKNLEYFATTKSILDAKPTGQSTFSNSIWSSASALEN